MVVFERGSIKEIEIDEDIKNIISSVSVDRIKKDLKKLVDYKTRWTFTSIFKDVIDDARANFDSMGYNAQILEWKTWKGTGYNVMAVKKGKSERQIVVVAHIDSTSPKKSTLAPGADDNGSGSAGVFEIARVLNNIDTEHTIVFLLAGGEEDGILGTNDYVKKYADRDIVDYVINMDMIGFTKSNPDVIFIETSSRFENFAQEIAAIGEYYCDFFSEISLRPFGSDHMPFINNGIPAVLTIEKDWDENKNYHQVTDTYNTIDFNFLERVVKMNTAAVLHFDKYIK
jgi:Zn-dependent M28 family amino/carboxypeptidase